MSSSGYTADHEGDGGEANNSEAEQNRADERADHYEQSTRGRSGKHLPRLLIQESVLVLMSG